MAKGPPRVHPAAEAFGGVAEAYERGRPGYPNDALAHLADGLGLGPGVDLLELAAGTGKLTRGLAPFGARITAIEPSEGMRTVFRRTCPGVDVRDGTAEAIPRPTGSVDAVAVGQAFHWFRTGPALAEIHRVLRPGGRLGLIWNRRDERVPWVAEFGRAIHTLDRGGAPNSTSEAWRAEFDAAPGFGPLRTASFPSEHAETIDQALDRALSVSFVASATPAERSALAHAIREVLRAAPVGPDGGTIRFPYVTTVSLAARS
jgi:SAM-dependent methyltransferase